MKKGRLVKLTISIFLLFFSLTSMNVSAEETNSPTKLDKIVFASGDQNNESIKLYKEESTESDVVINIPNQSHVQLLDSNTDVDFSFIQYTDPQTNIEYNGYIENKFLIDAPPEDQTNQVNDSNQPEEVQDVQDEANNEGKTTNPSDTNGEVDKIQKQRKDTKDQASNKSEQTEPKKIKDDSDATSKTFIQSKATAQTTQTKLQGIAIKGQTNVYSDPSSTGKVIKSYQQGTLLYYKTYSSEWYQANVYIDGVATTGFININDVENLVDTQQKDQGIASKNPTNIYEKPSTNGKVIKSYTIGTLLYYKTYTSNWYQANVYINGKATTGYIYKNDLDTLVQQKVRGIALKDSTKIYANTSTSGTVIKTYSKGTLLYYKTYISGWYQANVYINGKATTGYIYKNDVENIVSNQQKVQGIATKIPTNIYVKPSTDGKVIKTYDQGSFLYYKTLSANWYQANVYINGKATTGYIYKKDVEQIPATQDKVQGIAAKIPTKIYMKPSTGSKAIKSYQQGSFLYYKTYITNWYEANVYINGKATTGYIYKKDVENLVAKQENKQGLAKKSYTNVYAKPSQSGKVLKSYKKNTFLYFKTYTKNWYEANVYINGKATTGYIYKDDVSLDTVIISKYSTNLTLNKMVDTQSSKAPQTDLYRNKNAYVSKDYIKKISSTVGEVVNADTLNVREGPGTNYWIYGTLSKGNRVTIVSTTGNWYEIKYNTWRNAKTEDIKYYINPNSFVPNTPEYYQFLLLDKTTNISATEVDSKILYGKGSLSGTGSIFLDASKKYSINEMYLISHSLLETGNGTSSLAKGVVVNGKKVYNVFGYGAYDSCPIDCGAQFAYDHGWFSIAKAIEGAAQLIGQNYIHNGQNTLYKMRWYPENPYHQYATDIGWAVKQTANISKLYSLVGKYTLHFDVPVYN